MIGFLPLQKMAASKPYKCQLGNSSDFDIRRVLCNCCTLQHALPNLPSKEEPIDENESENDISEYDIADKDHIEMDTSDGTTSGNDTIVRHKWISDPAKANSAKFTGERDTLYIKNASCIWFQCPFCDKKFQIARFFHRHLETHHADEPSKYIVVIEEKLAGSEPEIESIDDTLEFLKQMLQIIQKWG